MKTKAWLSSRIALNEGLNCHKEAEVGVDSETLGERREKDMNYDGIWEEISCIN